MYVCKCMSTLVVCDYGCDASHLMALIGRCLHSVQVYMLEMGDRLWKRDVTVMNCSQIFKHVRELERTVKVGEQPHFKAAHTMNGRLVVAGNTFDEDDGEGGGAASFQSGSHDELPADGRRQHVRGSGHCQVNALSFSESPMWRAVNSHYLWLSGYF